MAVLAAIATIAAALLLAETTLVYFALGLGGISVLLLLAALIQGGIRAAGQDRTRTGTDGLGKSSVPAVASTAATPPGAHYGPEDSGRVPAPAHGPVRDSVVSEHGSTGFTPVTGEWPETATGSPDPDPARPHGHRPGEDTRPVPEPERFDYRIPYQGRTEDHRWAAAEPGTEGTEPFSDWTPSRPDEPNAADEAGLPTPADETPAGASTFTAFDADVPSDVEESVAADTAEKSDSADRADVPDDNADEAPRFNYRVPTADATDDVEAYPDDTEAGSHGADDDVPSPTGSAVVEPDAGIVEVDADQTEGTPEPGEPTGARNTAEASAGEGAFSYRVPASEPAEAEVEAGTSEPVETSEAVEPAGIVGFDTDEAQGGAEPAERAEAWDTVETSEPVEPAEAWDAVESTDTGADSDGGAFSYRVPTAEPFEDEADPGTSESAETTGSVEPVEASDTVETFESVEPAERVEFDTDQVQDGAEPGEPTGARATAETIESVEPAEASDTASDAGSEGDAGEGGFSYRVPTAEPAEVEGDTGVSEIDAEPTEDADEPDAGTSERAGSRDTVDVSGTAEPAEASETAEASGAGARAGGFSYRVPTSELSEPSEPPEPAEGDADETAAFSYRVPVADTDDDSPVAYAAILDPDDEPSSPDDSSRRQDPDQVS
ncbi:hypothetical protein [Nocardiopsis aegyptia]|uniref:Uncharacterized protein n=1 Tax=Nocardiopsis aegyptia TaxID=220378 RepID=A0A7Z0EJV1_9ACTN|nr:hypothetical protein [Nocardiopsis aegyptia]NYJ33297.1 hypothetical protein [Nocardiopsis aegyptia]